jgi:hypothetical protein
VLLTLVVRLRPDELALGEFVGEVESVGSGERAVVRGLSELAGFARQVAADDKRTEEQGVSDAATGS